MLSKPAIGKASNANTLKEIDDALPSLQKRKAFKNQEEMDAYYDDMFENGDKSLNPLETRTGSALMDKEEVH